MQRLYSSQLMSNLGGMRDPSVESILDHRVRPQSLAAETGPGGRLPGADSDGRPSSSAGLREPPRVVGQVSEDRTVGIRS
jgi:hypothetical protein